jgi:hypothetical protein
MARINSANPDFSANTSPTTRPVYRHGLEERRSFIPMAFQVTSPLNPRMALLPHALVLHVNPQSLAESHTKKIERIQTRGGFVEQHWGDELSEMSADGVTGAFMNIYTGLSSVMRQKSIAWDRYRDLYDLYRNNGSVHDPFGNIVLQGRIMLMYDRGTYFGHFKTFEVEETDDSPFMFKINWTFKVQETVLQIPYSAGAVPNGPSFQSHNHSGIPTTSTATRPLRPGESPPTAPSQEAPVIAIQKELQGHAIAGTSPKDLQGLGVSSRKNSTIASRPAGAPSTASIPTKSAPPPAGLIPLPENTGSTASNSSSSSSKSGS